MDVTRKTFKWVSREIGDITVAFTIEGGSVGVNNAEDQQQHIVVVLTAVLQEIMKV